MEKITRKYVFEPIAGVPGDLTEEDFIEDDVYMYGNDKQDKLPFVSYIEEKQNVIYPSCSKGNKNYSTIIKMGEHSTSSSTENEQVHRTRKSVMTYPSMSVQTDSILMSPENRLKTSSNPNSKKERTPRTLLRMMERHRENERVRHHTLNESMKNVCSYVPGSENLLKETKVVMMQRIIAYICYLENTIHDLCYKLGIKENSYHLTTNFLTDQWKESTSKIDHHKDTNRHNTVKAQKPKVKHRSNRKNAEHIEKRRLKLSSPTVDSTTDSCGFTKSTQENKTNNNYYSQESSSGDHELFLDDNACCVPDSLVDTNSYIFQHEDFLPTSTSLDNFPDAFELMSSPIGGTQSSLLSPKVKSMDNETCENIGIKSDKGDLRDTIHDITDHEMRTISPDCILPTNLFKSVLSDKYVVIPTAATYYSADSTDEQIVPEQHCQTNRNTNDENCAPKPQTPVKMNQGGKNKRKRYTPKHSPLLDVSNILTCDEDGEEESLVPVVPKVKRTKTSSQSVSGKVIKKVEGDVVSYTNPYNWKFHNTAITRRQKAETNKSGKAGNSSRFNNGEKTAQKSDKVDHRKTTWMNGFMMFSRLNRKKFIEANPGVHTSSISKMMGHAWRQMSDFEQEPYKEKAKDYADCMKNDNLLQDLTITSGETDDKL